MNKSDIERLYKKLMNDVETHEYYKIDLTNRVNCYVCKSCNHVTKTKDIDPGVISMMIACESCGVWAHSTFFKDIAPDKNPSIEWYRPTLEELIKLRKKNLALVDHVLSGGLMKRKIKP